MTRYATRTCHFCGLREFQPYMNRRSIRIEVGKSRSSISGSTVMGFIAGSKAAERAVERTVFRTSDRTYTRKRDVWVCSDEHCLSQAKAAAKEPEEHWIVTAVTGGVLMLVIGVFSNGGEGTQDANADAAVPVSTEMQGSPQLVEFAPNRFAPAGTVSDPLLEDTSPVAVEDELTRSLMNAMSAQVDEEVDTTVREEQLRLVEAEFRGADTRSRGLLQSALKEAGLYKGDVDGAWGPGTSTAFRSALDQYTADHPETYDLSSVGGVRAFFNTLLGF